MQLYPGNNILVFDYLVQCNASTIILTPLRTEKRSLETVKKAKFPFNSLQRRRKVLPGGSHMFKAPRRSTAYYKSPSSPTSHVFHSLFLSSSFCPHSLSLFVPFLPSFVLLPLFTGLLLGCLSSFLLSSIVLSSLILSSSPLPQLLQRSQSSLTLILIPSRVF